MPQQDRLKVLVPVDFSETSRRALAWAFDYATRAPCDVHILHVVEDHVSDLVTHHRREQIAAELDAISREAKEELERMAPETALRERIGRIHRHISRGRAAHEILRVANDLHAETIVIGTHGRSGLAGLLIGSVAEKVVRHAHCPVVCVKPGRA